MENEFCYTTWIQKLEALELRAQLFIEKKTQEYIKLNLKYMNNLDMIDFDVAEEVKKDREYGKIGEEIEKFRTYIKHESIKMDIKHENIKMDIQYENTKMDLQEMNIEAKEIESQMAILDHNFLDETVRRTNTKYGDLIWTKGLET